MRWQCNGDEARRATRERGQCRAGEHGEFIGKVDVGRTTAQAVPPGGVWIGLDSREARVPPSGMHSGIRQQRLTYRTWQARSR
jgi:hypothetical protein